MNDGVTLMIVHDEKMSINNSISFLLESYIECGKYMEEWDVSRNAIGEYPMFVEKWIWCTYYVCFPAMCICVFCTFTYKSEQTIFTTQTIFPFLLLFCIDQTNLFICNHLSQKCCRVVIRICSVILSINSGQWACYRVLYVYILVFTFFPYCFSKERYWICLRCFFLQLNRLNTQHPVLIQSIRNIGLERIIQRGIWNSSFFEIPCLITQFACKQQTPILFIHTTRRERHVNIAISANWLCTL